MDKTTKSQVCGGPRYPEGLKGKCSLNSGDLGNLTFFFYKALSVALARQTLIGAATLSICIWIKVDKGHLLDLTKDVSGTDLGETDLPSLLENALVVLIVAGAFIFLLGFLGCCGTVQNKSAIGKLFLKIYSTVVLVLFILEAAAVGVAMLFVDKAETKIKDYLEESLQNRYNGSFTSTETTSILYSSGGDPITLAWDVTQLQLRCCGTNNGTDYASNTLYWDQYRFIEVNGLRVNMTVPPTCCEIQGGHKALVNDMEKLSTVEFFLTNPQCPFTDANSTIPGCYEEVKNVILSNSTIFIATGCTTVAVELLCIIFSCCLAKRNHDEVVAQTKDD
ncbi:tetraspanin-1-like [Watersipora subatra]|uniref:tetraspanin-1-like n=1 Tax=Watersipora subatra TaxID=2589382 RepID=UPI00355C99A3